MYHTLLSLLLIYSIILVPTSLRHRSLVHDQHEVEADYLRTSAVAGDQLDVSEPLPGGCIRVIPPGEEEPTCCVSGFVYMDGEIVSGAEVTIETDSGRQVSVYTQTYAESETRPHYRLSLSSEPLEITQGETITMTARYSGHEQSQRYVVQPGGQQVDIVLSRSRFDDLGYQHEAELMVPSGHLRAPSGIAIDSTGNLYTVDSGHSQVQVFNHDGQPVRQWGERGTGLGEFNFTPPYLYYDVYQYHIALDKSGNVYVVDSGNQRIQKFSSTGTFITAWGYVDHGEQLFDPVGIAVDRNDNVYVTDGGANRVLKFTSSGTYLDSWNMPISDPWWQGGITVDGMGNIYVAAGDILKFNSSGELLASWAGGSNGIAVDMNGNVYVTSMYTGGSLVTKYSSNGILLDTWGEEDDPIQFSDPIGIAIDTNGNVYLAEYGRDRILKLTSDGALLSTWGDSRHSDGVYELNTGTLALDEADNIFVANPDGILKFTGDGLLVSKWGSAGSHDGQFKDPEGIAVDRNGNIYVADTGNHRIQKFSSTGAFIAKWGSEGNANGQFISPSDIVVDNNGNVYIVDAGNDRIQRFSSSGNFVTSWSGIGSGKIAVDNNGNLYVLAGDYVLEYSGDGTLLKSWETGLPSFYLVMTDIAVDTDDNVYISVLTPHALVGGIDKYNNDGMSLGNMWYRGSGDGEWLAPQSLAINHRNRLAIGDELLQRFQVLQPMAMTQPVATITHLVSPSLEPNDTLVAYGLGQDSDETPEIAAYRWTSDVDGLLGTTATLSYPASQLTPGAHRLSLSVQDTEGQWSQPVTTDILVTQPAVPAWTMLLYLAGDYQDGGSLLTAFNATLDNLKTQFTNPHVRIAVQVDGPADGDTRRLLITPGTTSSAPKIQTFPMGELAMDQHTTLSDFIAWGQQKFPADNYYLAIADHGQALQGMSWDHTSEPSGSAYLTATELGQALRDPDIDTIDILHLDACSLNLLEVAYEARTKASIVIASQYLGWNYFAYDAYQRTMGATTTPRTVARAITASYAERARREHVPFTIAALNLQRAESTLTAVDNLAAELAALVANDPTNRAALQAIWENSQKFESNGDKLINALDVYVDLVDWTERVQEQVNSPAVQERAAQLLKELSTGSQPFIIALSNQVESNPLPSSYAGGAYIDVSGAHGLSIFYPARPNSEVYRRYLAHQLFTFTRGSRWDELLLAAVGPVPDGPLEPPPGPLPPLDPTPPQLEPHIFVPITRR